MNVRANFTSRIADRLIAHTVSLFRYDAGLRRQIRKLLAEKVERELVAQLIRDDPTLVARPAYREQRVRQLTKEAQSIIRAGYREVATAHERAMRDLAVLEEEFARTTVNRVVGTEIATISIPDVKLREIGKSVLIDGAPSRNWWAGQAERTRVAFERTVRRGLTQGDSITAIVQRVRSPRAVASEAITPGATLAQSYREAEALVRTSVLSVSNAVRAESFRANSDIIRGEQALVTMDSRTSETCLALGAANAAWDLDGNPLPESGWQYPKPPGPPFHWNCRTILVPVLGKLKDIHAEVGSAKQGKLDALARDDQRALDGRLAEAATGLEKWLSDKPDAFVDDLLGKTRAGLWREGKLKLPQLIDQTGRPLNLSQLRDRVRNVTDKAIEEARAA